MSVRHLSTKRGEFAEDKTRAVATATLQRAKYEILSMLPVTKNLATLLVDEAERAIDDLIASGLVGLRKCGVTGATVVCDRRPSIRYASEFVTAGSGAKTA